MEHDHMAPPVAEREPYTRRNTEGKVIRVLCEALYDCPNNRYLLRPPTERNTRCRRLRMG